MIKYGYEITDEKPAWYIIEKELRMKLDMEMFIPCIDHIKFGRSENEVTLISEPYDISMENIKELIKFCELRGLQFTIWGDSIHSPGNTFEICIHCGDDVKYNDYEFWIGKIKSLIEKEQIDKREQNSYNLIQFHKEP